MDLVGLALPSLLFILVVVIVFLYLSIRIVRQYERMVIFRLGRTNPSLVREPGLRFLIPIVDRPVKVDIRENFTEVPSQTVITRDNAPVDIDFLIYWKIVEPMDSLVNVGDFQGALQGPHPHGTLEVAALLDVVDDMFLAGHQQKGPVQAMGIDVT